MHPARGGCGCAACHEIDVTRELLNLPVEPPRTSPTPERAAFIAELIADGLLARPIGEHVLGLGAVTDAVWDALAPLRYARRGIQREPRTCWQVTLGNASGLSLELPTPYDAAEHANADQPPLAALSEMLAALADQGWHPTWGDRAP